jgi:hypothetical protein
VQVELVFDRERNLYLLIEVGWEKSQRIYGTLLHLAILNDRIWIQQDGTEEGIAEELVAAGIPEKQIVLAYKSEERRRLTRFAIA